MKVLFLDDHLIVAEALSQFFKSQFPEAEVHICNRSEDKNHFIGPEKNYDFIFCDLNFNGVYAGFTLIKEIKFLYPLTPVIVLSMHSEKSLVTKSIDLGANGFITKSDPPDSIIEAIHQTKLNVLYLSPTILSTLEDSDLTSEQKLSSREQEIASLVTSGLSSKEIAEKLNISHRTVEVHRRNMMKKMGVTNTAQLVNQLKIDL